MSIQPAPFDLFRIGVRVASVALCAIAVWRGGGWGIVGAVLSTLSLARVPRRRLVVGIAGAAALLGALTPGAPLPFLVTAVATLFLIPLAPESGALPLNALDQYFIVQDYPGTPMNSHHFVDIDDPLARAPLVQAIDSLLVEIPMARSFVRESLLGVERFVARRPFVAASALLTWSDEPVEANASRLLDRRLDLERAPPWRVVHAPRIEGGYRLVLTIHHSAVDGESGFLFLDWLIQRYNEHQGGCALAPRPLAPHGPRFRTLLKPQGLSWNWRAVRRHVHPFAKIGVKNAHLLDDEAARPTHSRHLLVQIPPALWAKVKPASVAVSASRNDLLISAALRAADGLCRARGRPDLPFRILLPTNLRKTFGLPLNFGNYVSSLRFEVTPVDVRSLRLPAIVHALTRDGRALEDVIETPVNLGVIGALLPPSTFRAALRKYDADPGSHFFSFVFSTMRTAPEPHTPSGTRTERILFRGSLPRRPGFGVAVTRHRDEVFLAIDYLAPNVRDETAREFRDRLFDELSKLTS